VWSHRCTQFFTEIQRKFNSIKNSVHEDGWIRPSFPIYLTKFCLTIPLELDILYLLKKMRKPLKTTPQPVSQFQIFKKMPIQYMFVLQGDPPSPKFSEDKL
jgi:hypothetical protein